VEEPIMAIPVAESGDAQQEKDMRKTVRKPAQKASKKPLRDLTTLEERATRVKAGARVRPRGRHR
jgi:hypothetical protein